MVSNILRPPQPKKPEKENEPPSESQPCTSAHLQLPLAQCSDVQVPTTSERSMQLPGGVNISFSFYNKN